MSFAAITSNVRVRPVVDRQRVILNFATLNIFSVIYLQKIALFSPKFMLSVPMLVLFLSSAYMMVNFSGYLTIVPRRLAAYLIFTGCCLFSEAFAHGSILSLLLLLTLYATTTVEARVDESTCRKIFNRYVMMMILPSGIIIVQYFYQIITHRSDPLSMDAYLPHQFMLMGYNYAAHTPWNSYFIRPNGFFFLEPSWVSCFLAVAFVLEITYFRRYKIAILLIAATFLCKGDTGLVLLIVAAPFLLARERPQIVIMAVVCGILSVSVAYALNVPLPLISRTTELQTDHSSAGERLVLPTQELLQKVFDPSYLAIGNGAGDPAATKTYSPQDLRKIFKSQRAVSNPWPIVKVVTEYGLLSMIAFILLFSVSIAGNFNIPLKVGLGAIYMFTGGYLLSPIMVVLVILMCFMFVPDDSQRAKA